MSAPVQTDENPSMFPTMYAPPWAREEKRDIPGDAGMAAVDKALNASEALRRTLPPAAPLELADGKRRWRDKPFAMPQPLQGLTKPAQPKAIVPQPVIAERVVASAEPIAFADRVAAVPAKADLPPAVPARAVPADPPAPPAPPPPILRSLDQAEIEMLVKRSEALIAQGDIAAARLMLTRAAEAGDARAALVLAGTFDADILRKLGVLGVAGDAAQARIWYAKAAEYGSGEASRRLEQLAQSAR